MRKKLTLFLVVLFGVLILPFSVNAEVENVPQTSINEIKNVFSERISITDLKFNNYENTSTLAYGLSGMMTNQSHDELTVSINVVYFDASGKIVSTSTTAKSIYPNDSSVYLQMSNSQELENGYKVSDIAYYSMEIEVHETNPSVTVPTKPSEYADNDYQDYVIDYYDVDIKVNENNTLDITETITAYFNINKHGIFRTIPLRNEVKRLDGTTTKNRTKVSNLKVNEQYTKSRTGDSLEVKIGDPNYTLTGEKKYIISYTYNMGKDPMKDYDEFYHDIIGSEWDTVIGNITFKITMPKEFNPAKLGFSSGAVGSTNNSKVEYSVNGNVITGKYYGELDAHEALTVRLELEEGYFVGAGFNNEPGMIALFVIPLLCLIIAYLIWAKYGNDDEIVETIEFYPPAGVNSLIAGFLFKGKATNEDVVSLLIYLANKGYLKIEETNRKTKFSDSGIKITKLREYDGYDENERLFFDGLFKRRTYTYRKSLGKAEEEYKESVTTSDLYNRFYRTMNKIIENINKKNNIHEIYEKGSLNKKVYVILLLVLSVFTTIAIPTYDFGGLEFIGISCFIILFYLPFYIAFGGSKMSLGAKIMVFGFLVLHSSMFMMALPITEAIFTEKMYLLSTIYGIACAIGLIAICNYMPKRTPYGAAMLGKLQGFKRFLETAEKERLEAMVMENPNYFYDVLPYTYVLGISDKWIKQFEEIGLQAPDWYDGHNHFNPNTFGKFLTDTIASTASSMSSSPSSSSGGGGSSGGGSSGGGSGGGGGGSW